MKKALFSILWVLAFVFSHTASAIPADPTPITIKQPNGKALTLMLQGDEHFHWATTLDGYTLVRDSRLTWVYAMPDAVGNLVPSGVTANNVEERTDEDRAFLKTISPFLSFPASQIASRDPYRFSTLHEPAFKSYPANGTVKLLVILVDFTDVPFSYGKQNFQDLVAQDGYSFNGATGSVKDYYRDNSGGQFIMDIDVVGPVHLSRNMAYYGAPSGMHNDARVNELLREAIRLVDDSVDFSLYDNNHDGIVDAFHVIYAGTPESSTQNPDEIWPHRFYVYNAHCNDNVGFRDYSISSEKQTATRMVGIGTICHEFGHVLGLPDWYDTDYRGSGGISVEVGQWSLMSAGPYLNNGNTPPYLSAVERELLGWHRHTYLSTPSENNILYPIQDSNRSFAALIKQDSSEFFAMEYRIKAGWDRFLPGHGMLIYHVDKSVNNWYHDWKNNGSGDNSLNANPSNRGYYIEIANNQQTNVDQPGAAFGVSRGTIPATRHFTPYTTPGARSKAGQTVNTPITNIQEHVSNHTLTFNFQSSHPEVITLPINPGNSFSPTLGCNYLLAHRTSGITSGILYTSSGIDSLTFASASMATGITLLESGSATLRNLTPGTTYNYRAYVIGNQQDTSYGEVLQFTTGSGLGQVVTNAADQITKTTMRLHGRKTGQGTGSIYRMGFCLIEGESVTPTLTNSRILLTSDTLSAAFSADADNLTEGTLYSYRAFIENSYGVNYGVVKTVHTDYTPILHNNIVGEPVRTYCLPDIPDSLIAEQATGGVGEIHYRWVEIHTYGQSTTAPGISNQQNYQPPATAGSRQYSRIAYCNDVVTHKSVPVTINMGQSVAGTAAYTGQDTIEANEYVYKLTITGQQGSVVRWERNINNRGWEEVENTANKVTAYDKQTAINGVYRYRCVIRHFECEEVFSNEVSVVVKNGVGMEDLSQETSRFTFHPNPSDGMVNLITDTDQPYTVSVTTLDGKQVFEKAFHAAKTQVLDLSALSAGAYIIHFTTDKHTSSQPLVIQ